MNHSEVQMRLADYLEGDLPLSERALVDAHLDQCESCAAELSGLQQTIALLRSLPDPEPPVGLSQAVMQRLRDGEGQPRLLERLQRFVSELASVRIAVPATAAAALVAVAVASGDLDLSRLAIRSGDGPHPTREVRPDASARAPRVDPGSRRLAAAPSRVSEGETEGFVRGRDPARPGSSATPQPVAHPNLVESHFQAMRSEAARLPRAGLPDSTVREAPSPRLVPVASESPYPGVAQSNRSDPILGGAEYVVQFPSTPPHPDILDLEKVQRVRLELDRRLDLLIRDTESFFRYLRTDSTAAQELWMVELAERAVERQITEQALEALRRGGDLEALSLADVFESAVRRAERERVASESRAGDR